MSTSATSTLALGIDPDTKSTGWALLERRGSEIEILNVGIVRAKGRLASDRTAIMAAELDLSMCQYRLGIQRDQLDIVAIEFMHLRPSHTEKNPNSILAVQAIAGMCVSATLSLRADHLLTPTPTEWKGTMEKKNKQAWILRKYGLDAELRYIHSAAFPGGEFVPGAGKLLKSMRTHVIDAIGIAAWALDPYGPLFKRELDAKARARTRLRRSVG